MRAVACVDAKLSVVELPDPAPERGSWCSGAALRHLRLRPARPRALRRPGRGDGGARLRRVHADHVGDRAWATSSSARCSTGRGARRDFRDGRRMSSRSRWSGAARTCTRSGSRRWRRVGTPSRSWSSSRCRSWSPTGWRPTSRCSPSRWRWRLHAVNRADGLAKDVAIVLGCGPVGLAVICWLKARGVRTIVASRPLGRPTRPGRGVRRGRRRRPDRGLAVRRRRVQARDLGARPVPASRSARWTSCRRRARLAARLPRRRRRGGRDADGAGRLRVRRRPRDDRVRRLAGAAGLAAWSWSASAWAATASGPRWRSTRSSTCGSCSATRRWSSATPCTRWPTGRSTPRRCVTGTVGLDGVASAFDALGDPESARQDPHRPSLERHHAPSVGLVARRATVDDVTLALSMPGPPATRIATARSTRSAGAASSSSAPRARTRSTPRPASGTTT